MATVYVRFGPVMGGGAPAYQKGGTFETFTSSGTTQPSTMTARNGDFARVSSVGGVVRVAFAAAPTAIADEGEWVLDGQTIDVGPLAEGDKIAVIDAS